MTIVQWLQVLCIGALAGAVGQLVRAVSGLAKSNRARAGSADGGQGFDPATLVISLVVGATAGALAAVAMQDQLGGNVQTPTILGLMAAGYAGADFIEGFAGKHFQGSPAEVVNSPSPTPSPAPPSPPPPPMPAAPATPDTAAVG
jgi:uncharacterized membrane protein YeaQ/YmgE (transglycosylase-associated protein family)